MEGQRIVLNDSTVIENGRAGYSEGYLWLFFSGYTMLQIAQMFCDTSKTAVIVFKYGEMQETYENFTVCTTMNIDIDGNASVCMKRGT